MPKVLVFTLLGFLFLLWSCYRSSPKTPSLYVDLRLTKGLYPGPMIKPVKNMNSISARECGSCHQKQYEEWNGSRHQLGFMNDIFLEGYRFEKKEFCVNCHAPLQNQVMEIGDHTVEELEKMPKNLLPLTHEGITCVTCHVRENKILTLHDKKDNGVHEFRTAKNLGSPEFCANCHQFNFPNNSEDIPRFTHEPMQNTLQEWRYYAKNAPQKAERKDIVPNSCQSCHMPQGMHTFRGAHDTVLLRNSVELRFYTQNDSVFAYMASVGVGHEYPTGDLFRHLNLTIKNAGNETVFKYRIGREFAFNGLNMSTVKNTSLKPNQPQRVFVGMQRELKNTYYALTYHYTSERDEVRSPHLKAILTLKQGKVIPDV